MRRRAEQDHVDAAVDELPVGVEADETVVGLDVELADHFLVALEDFQALLEPISEDVGQGDELDIRLGRKRLGRRTGAAVATADQADAQHVAAGGVYIRERRRRPGGGRCREKITARG